MEDFTVRASLREALEIYLFLDEREAELQGGTARLLIGLRSYLYDRLSIEQMESPRELLAKLDSEAR